MHEASFVIAYDFSDDKERSRVEKCLQGYGLRMQKSVFEARLSKGRLAQLQRDLRRLSFRTGFVRIYRLSAQHTPINVGQSPPDPEQDVAWIL
ncbi:CRISPR-associated endonuclease Cas2 [bacterium]|nr:CRISPR-associated endonuclease Cas2 [bacterium]